MKTFETPVVDVKKFDVMDVLTTSGGDDEDPGMSCCGDTCFS